MTEGTIFRNPLIWILFVGLIAVGAFRSRQRAEPPSEPPAVAGPVAVEKQLPSFALVNADGDRYGSEDLRGQVWVANFFFTRCMTICPAMMANMADLQARLRASGVDGVRLVSFSVDPEHDTPERLVAYAEEQGVDTSVGWDLLTGPASDMRALLVDGFEVPMGVPELVGETLIDVAHSGKVALVDRKGAIRGYFNYDEPGLAEVFERSRELLAEPVPAL